MGSLGLIHALFIIFAGAAILSTLALLTRQSMLVAYMLLGIIIGPWGLGLIPNTELISHVGTIGILFLLFLLGLHLPPQKLQLMLRKISMVGIASSLIFMALGFAVARLMHLNNTESLIVGASMMFSSTIIGIKLLPTTILHHQHTGEVMISVLLFQDIVAIITLLLLHGSASGGLSLQDTGIIVFGFPIVCLFAFLVERFILTKLFAHFNRVREYLFLVSIAWCLSLAELAEMLHLSAEIGAFIAGVTIAASPIALYIAESLRPIRDFFLIMFFFSVGATFDLTYLHSVILYALLLAGLMLAIKPWVFRWLLQSVGETRSVSWEVGVRLAQVSEFSLIITAIAMTSHLIEPKAAYLIQATTIITFLVSSYWVVMRYPTPMALSDKMRRD